MTPNIKELSGAYGRWTVLGFHEVRKQKAFWLCRCECGTERAVSGASLINGRSTSCGCRQREVVGATRAAMAHSRPCRVCGTSFRTPPSSGKVYCCIACRRVAHHPNMRHGESHTRLHRVWCGMKSRCRPQTKHVHRQYYAQRGVSVSEEWSKSYEAFAKWARQSGYADNLEIDRIDNDGNYCPENCRWATRHQQMQNTRKRSDARTSKFKGVSWCANVGRWRAQIVAPERPSHIGFFSDETECARAYDAKAREVFGEFACTNF